MFVYLSVLVLWVYESRVNVDLLWQSEEDLPSGRGYKKELPSVLTFPQTYIKWHYTDGCGENRTHRSLMKLRDTQGSGIGLIGQLLLII